MAQNWNVGNDISDRGSHMALSKRSIETLLDLVEIKLSCLCVTDREDAREQATLEACRRELSALGGMKNGSAVLTFPTKSAPKTQSAATA